MNARRVVIVACTLLAVQAGRGMAGKERWPEEALRAATDYAEGRYAESAAGYRAAMEAGDPRPELAYNLGNALYRAADGDSAALAGALSAYQRAAASGDAALRAPSVYNAANTEVWRGELQQAEGMYREVLRQDPSDELARYNLELVQRILEAQPPDSSGQSSQDSQSDENQQKQDGQQEPQSSENQDQEQPDQSQPEQQPPPEDASSQDQQPPQPGQDEQPPDASQQPPQEGSQPPEQSPREEESSISPEEARRELDKLDEVERELMRQLLEARQRRIDVEKDW